MATIVITFVLAFGLMILALSLLGIGKILTGKHKIKPGACGRDPSKNNDDCDTRPDCSLCKKPKNKCE